MPLQILAPIASIMISSPALIALLSRVGPRVFGVLCLIPIVIDAVLPVPLPYFWHYYFVACFGLWFGAQVAENWDRCMAAVGKMSVAHYLVVLAVFLGLDGAAVFSLSAYNILLNRLAPNLVVILMFFFATGLPVLRIHDLGGRPVGPLLNTLATLGRHTLFVYLLQVTLLNLIRFSKVVRPSENIATAVVVSVGVTAVCCVCAFGVGRLGERGKRVYSLIFE